MTPEERQDRIDATAAALRQALAPALDAEVTYLAERYGVLRVGADEVLVGQPYELPGGGRVWQTRNVVALAALLVDAGHAGPITRAALIEHVAPDAALIHVLNTLYAQGALP